ncbi:MAG: hypothetical protein KGL39_36540 [Patescibacteria group bacterium]|nr:hypothetical protein [Patescibacteria group bacterium]
METLRKWLPLNFELLANPVNWAIIVLMIALAGLGLALIFKKPNEENS